MIIIRETDDYGSARRSERLEESSKKAIKIRKAREAKRKFEKYQNEREKTRVRTAWLFSSRRENGLLLAPTGPPRSIFGVFDFSTDWPMLVDEPGGGGGSRASEAVRTSSCATIIIAYAVDGNIALSGADGVACEIYLRSRRTGAFFFLRATFSSDFFLSFFPPADRLFARGVRRFNSTAETRTCVHSRRLNFDDVDGARTLRFASDE